MIKLGEKSERSTLIEIEYWAKKALTEQELRELSETEEEMLNAK